ncbi:bifunctional riboflavin kinase/FAD synthetase [Pseudomonadales bacterium]|nr:bifunctional riboflavin kinase/FAD synthetase [Pseudomonadales bacterium]MDB4420864.1 bifunctional riboflavin kinase/FAD synthetase [Pseudomonadales bacterium]
MQIIRGLHNLFGRYQHALPNGCVATMGAFDGLHKGHRAVLDHLVEVGARMQLPSVVVILEPLPREYFAPLDAPSRLMSFREKVEGFAALGIDFLLVVRFDDGVRNTEAADFIERVFVQGLATVHLVMGDDSQFGRSGSGDYKLLESLGRQHAFSVEPTPTFEFAGGRVSSTRIRELLEHGEFAQAEELLGRAYSISGKVIYGRQLGRELGAPTANISLHRIQAAMAGVYAVEARLVNSSQSVLERPSDWMTGVANVGVRPTVDANVKAILEVHLIDFQGDLYGRQMEVRFLHKIRDEQRFSDVTQLQSQIERDVADTRSWFGAN